LAKSKGKIPSSLDSPDKEGQLPRTRRFILVRETDVSGNSGTGTVAIGIIFPSGICAMEWTSVVHSVGVYGSIADLEKIHGHDGATKVRVLD
jgi:hypothetical protein